METYLMHHGIKGQRWGVRRYQNEDGSYTPAGKKRRIAENYSEIQRRRDRQVYGSGGERRINRNMLDGDSISTARSREAERINNTRRAARVGGQIGGVAGGIGGVIGGVYLNKYLSKKYPDLNNPAIALIIDAGAATVGKQIGAYGGRAATMVARGYSPSKYR